MSWSGGSYTKGNAATGGWAGDASLGIGIEAGRHDTQDNDFATGINNCLAKDGQNAMTANINLGGYVPTNVGAGTAAAPAYCAGNDSNTGMFSAAADNIGFATNGSERVRIDNTGKVGIGTTSPSYDLVAQNNQNASTAMQVHNPNTGAAANSQIILGNNSSATAAALTLNSGGNTTNGGVSSLNLIQGLSAPLTFATAGSERMRINANGDVGIGLTPISGRKLEINGLLACRGNSNSNSFTTSGVAIAISYVGAGSEYGIGIRPINDNSTALEFKNAANTNIGSISTTSTATAFNTSSDYRLKENVGPISAGLDRLAQLKPCRFNFISEPHETIDGFLAHEVAEVVPNAVFGAKDAVNEDGSIKVQALDNSKLVPLLTAAIQELNAKVEALEARVAVLEA